MTNQTTKKKQFPESRTKTSNYEIDKYEVAKKWAQTELVVENNSSSLFSELEMSYKTYLEKNNFSLTSEYLQSNELSFFLKIYASLFATVTVRTRRTFQGIRYEGVAVKTFN